MKLSALFTGAPDIDITGLTADSRKVAPGFVFAALGGTAAHGRDFVEDAIARGAA
ncbi:MAG: Mur ligase domain-containing protein, partial [Hyphomonadaceae bacterium]